MRINPGEERSRLKMLAKVGKVILDVIVTVVALYLIVWLLAPAQPPSSSEYRKKRRFRDGRKERRLSLGRPKTVERTHVEKLLEGALKKSKKREIRVMGWREISRELLTEESARKYTASLHQLLDIKYDAYLGLLEALEREGGQEQAAHMQQVLFAGKARERKRYSEIMDAIIARRQLLTPEVVHQNLTVAFCDPEHGFPSVVGRTDIKDWLARHALLVRDDPVSASRACLNAVFLGPSGVGKTRSAELVSFFFCRAGVFVFGNVVKGAKKDFTGPYVDSGTHMASEMMTKSLENVLFFDEAYSLANGAHGVSGHSQGAIDQIVAQVEQHEGLTSIVMCGYARQMMGGLFGANEGLMRRFPNIFELRANSPEALAHIFFRFLETRHASVCRRLSRRDRDEIYSVLVFVVDADKTIFPRQAGDMKNLASLFSGRLPCTSGATPGEVFVLCLRDMCAK